MNTNSDADTVFTTKDVAESEWNQLLYYAKTSSGDRGDPTHRVFLLDSARKPVVCVSSDATVAHAFTLMMSNNYSQLPVMDDRTNVEGIFGWRSFGKTVARGVNCTKVVEAMEPAATVELTDSIFEAFAVVASRDYVLVRDKDKSITGIVTAYDVSDLFAKLSEPFLLLEEIEKRIRVLLKKHVTPEELRNVNERRRSGTEPTSLEELTFGSYVKLIENPEIWSRLGFRLDQTTFVKLADEVREARNELVHFRPLGISEQRRETLRRFAQFLRDLHPL
jgi:predicted transcriptional regulator